jgi:hypothetical protein
VSSQSPRDLEEVVLRNTPVDGTPRPGARRAVDHAWEAVVREELARMRRGRTRRGSLAAPPRTPRAAPATGDEDAAA